MEASMIRAALDARGWKKIAISADTVLAVLDGRRVALRFDGEMMFDPVDERHVLCTSLIGLVDGIERARVERWPLVEGEEGKLLDEAAWAVEVAVRVIDADEGDDDE